MLDFPIVGEDRPTGPYTRITFLDEFRMAIPIPKYGGRLAEFTVFNTALPQGHPGNSRPARLPIRIRNWSPFMNPDRNMSLGTPNQDGPLIVDPAQAICVVNLACGQWTSYAMAPFRAQDLIERVCAMDTDAPIPWDK